MYRTNQVRNHTGKNQRDGDNTSMNHSIDAITRINDPNADVRSNAASFKTGFAHGFGKASTRGRATHLGDGMDVETLKKQNDILINGIRSLPDGPEDYYVTGQEKASNEDSYLVPTKD